MTANGKYKNVYTRIYTSKTTGKVTCKLPKCKKVKGMFKRRKLKIDDLTDESFKLILHTYGLSSVCWNKQNNHAFHRRNHGY